jgi:hypothetical protein
MAERDPKTGRFPKRPSAPKGGTGYGGAAKGQGQRVPLDEVRPLRWDKDNLAAKEEVAAQMRGVLYQVAMAGDAEASRINAADKLLDRIEGKPMQRSEVSGPDGKALPAGIQVTFVRPGEA